MTEAELKLKIYEFIEAMYGKEVKHTTMAETLFVFLTDKEFLGIPLKSNTEKLTKGDVK